MRGVKKKGRPFGIIWMTFQSIGANFSIVLLRDLNAHIGDDVMSEVLEEMEGGVVWWGVDEKSKGRGKEGCELLVSPRI